MLDRILNNQLRICYAFIAYICI